MTTAQAFPAKRFFVEMLVRDIELKDALLDLLDNCVDGAMRTTHPTPDAVNPYENFRADITFNDNHFSISDNCGGIPFDVAEKSAFRLGRKEEDLDEDLPTVGLYGIGMKRAIFKIGTSAEVTSLRRDRSFSVKITPEWMQDDDNWQLEMVDIASPDNMPNGTTIRVENLRPGISKSFSQEQFLNEFLADVRAYYSYIIEKGFTVTVNGKEATAKKIGFLMEDNVDQTGRGIAPFIYRRQGQPDGVDIYLSVGLYRTSPTEEEEDQELEGRASTENAGWTIICNDRVVLYADKTRLTGWGEGTVPAYHTQFVAIAGVVIFKSNDPSKLPLTTTKRGVDANSELYMQIKDFMRDGLKLFTSYTNRWKKRSTERKEREMQSAILATVLPEELSKRSDLKYTAIRKTIGGEQSRPDLPAPQTFTDRWIRFSKPESEIKILSQEFFGVPDAKPSDVGEECFARALREAEA